MEITDDAIAMEAIAFLQEKGYSIEQVLLAMAAKPAAEPEPEAEDLPPWPIGTVVRDTKKGYRIVLTHPLLRSDAYEFVCEKAHGEKPHPDYSYICNERWCRCRS
jgi:hypothetical protein